MVSTGALLGIDFGGVGAGAHARPEHGLPGVPLGGAGPPGRAGLAARGGRRLRRLPGGGRRRPRPVFVLVPTLYAVVKLAGAGYLLWLAWRTLRPGGHSPFTPAPLPPDPPRRLFTMGLVTNLLNPKIAILYVSLLPQFIDPTRGHVATQSLLLGLTQIAVALSVNALIVFSAGALAGFFARRPVWLRVQRWVTGTALAGAGRPHRRRPLPRGRRHALTPGGQRPRWRRSIAAASGAASRSPAASRAAMVRRTMPVGERGRSGGRPPSPAARGGWSPRRGAPAGRWRPAGSPRPPPRPARSANTPRRERPASAVGSWIGEATMLG